jgi:hypothetical protein
MKKLIFILLLFISNTLYSQQFYEAKTFSFCTIKRGERWTEWTEVELIKASIEVDSADGTIVLYTNRVATYSIYKTDKFINDGEVVYWFFCEDDSKVLCNIQLVLDRNGYNKNEMEIRYADLKLRYELK